MPADVRDRGARPRSRSREKRRLSPPRERERDRDFKRPRRSRSRSRDRRDRDRAQAGPKSLDFAARQAARGDGAMEDRPREAHPRDGRNMRVDRDRDLRPSDGTRSDRGPSDSFRHRDREDRGQGRPGEGDPAARANGASSRPIAAGNGAGLGVPMVQGGADLPAAPKKDPLSLDELLKKKQEEQAASAKPKFLTKREREELTLKRREEEAALQHAKQAELAKGHDNYLSTARQVGPPENGRRHDDPRQRFDRGPDRRRDRREREPQDPRERGERELERERQLQAELIKKQYLGGDKQKKKMLKPSEKFKFNFDWEAQDDTSQDANPLYKMTHEASLLFGRGMRAGMDRREQMKAAASAQQDLMAKMRQHTGVAETQEDRDRDKERTRMADKFEDMVKDRHWSEKGRELMTERDWRIFREDFNIAYRGNHVTLPIRNWTESGLPDPLLKAVEKMGYKTPSPIQMAAIPLGLQQRDVIGIAETGSGKTAAFTLPMLVYIMGLPKMTEEVAMDGPYAVVMAPTRELAQQIEEEAVKMASFTDFRMVSVVGGQPIEEQGFKLRKGCEIVIATPGRLGDCLEKAYAVLNQCNYVVLDEADRMIDLGFEPQVMQVLDAMPSSNLKPEDDEAKLEADRKYRTTYMFSATMPPTVERLAKKYLRRPVTITIGSAGRATDNVTQRVMLIKENEKPRMLDSELSHLSDDRKVIVFVNTKRQCDAVQRHLEPQGYNCAVLHGGKDQNQREASLLGFREGRYNVLIATDVAGRGIDVPDVAMVLNYDMPLGVEAYTHRIGRTGRAGKKGVASTFLTLGDQEVFYDLKKLLEDCKAPVPPELARHEASKVKPGSLEAQGRKPQTMYAKK